MYGIHAFLLALVLIIVVNIVRYISTLRALLFLMKEVDPMLYLEVGGEQFFKPKGNLAKQKRLYSYLMNREYMREYDDAFIDKCRKIRRTFILTNYLLVTLVVAVVMTDFMRIW